MSELEPALELAKRLAGLDIEVAYGLEGLRRAASLPESEAAVTAVVGMAVYLQLLKKRRAPELHPQRINIKVQNRPEIFGSRTEHKIFRLRADLLFHIAEQRGACPLRTVSRLYIGN